MLHLRDRLASHVLIFLFAVTWHCRSFHVILAQGPKSYTKQSSSSKHSKHLRTTVVPGCSPWQLCALPFGSNMKARSAALCSATWALALPCVGAFYGQMSYTKQQMTDSTKASFNRQQQPDSSARSPDSRLLQPTKTTRDNQQMAANNNKRQHGTNHLKPRRRKRHQHLKT